MSQFRFRGLNAQRRPVSGEIAADNVQHAASQLESQGVEILSIGLVSEEPARRKPASASHDVASEVQLLQPQIHEFCNVERQLFRHYVPLPRSYHRNAANSRLPKFAECWWRAMRAMSLSRLANFPITGCP